MSSCNFFRPLPHTLFKRAVKNEPYDVIIVPGYPFDGKDWATVMKGRVIWANFLIKNGVAKNVIFSGAAVYTPYIEGEIMALYAEAIGIPKGKIFVESKAEHGTENIYYSYQMAKKMGFTKIAFASDPIQSNYLMGFSKRRFKLPIAHIPFVIDTLKKIDDIHPVIDPSSAKVENFKSIIDTQTKRHRRRGSMGKNIKFEKE
ncbi:MAG: YdcF family protein [Bacteroidetes bacterium]|nr:YdcF family protein [Bacteroidota bacterium]